MTTYNTDNIFAKILRKEIPCRAIIETEYSLSFHDVFPKTPIHALVIPKNNYIDLPDFLNNASSFEVMDFWNNVSQTINILKIEEKGFRLINNCGIDGGQEVPHFHIHLCGGKKLGPMIGKF